MNWFWRLILPYRRERNTPIMEGRLLVHTQNSWKIAQLVRVDAKKLTDFNSGFRGGERSKQPTGAFAAWMRKQGTKIP